MDENLQTFWCTLLGFAGFGVLGGAFGALSAAALWRRGQTAGGVVGHAVARAVVRVRREPLGPLASAALVGAVDGSCFLGGGGLFLGLGIGVFGGGDWILLLQLMGGTLALALAAWFFGWLAGGLVRSGSQTVSMIFVGGVLGGAGGFVTAAGPGLFTGALCGSLAGALYGVFRSRQEPME